MILYLIMNITHKHSHYNYNIQTKKYEHYNIQFNINDDKHILNKYFKLEYIYEKTNLKTKLYQNI